MVKHFPRLSDTEAYDPGWHGLCKKQGERKEAGMKKFALLIVGLMSLSAAPALANLSVTFVNHSDFEIQAIKMSTDKGTFSTAIRVVPGNFCVISDGFSSELREVKIDAGVMLFSFSGFEKLAGMAAPVLEISFDADDRPHLTLGGEDASKLINVVGEATLLVEPFEEAMTDFSAVMEAESADAIKFLFTQESEIFNTQLYLPVNFAGRTWVVFVEEDDGKIASANLRTFGGYHENPADIMLSMMEDGWRPWYAQLETGGDMELEEALNFWEEGMDAEEAWEQVAAASVDIFQGDGPAAVDSILIRAEDYDAAAGGENPAAPGFRLRVSNSSVITMQYLPDISMLMALTR